MFLLNDNTFMVILFGHMVKDCSFSEREIMLLP